MLQDSFNHIPGGVALAYGSVIRRTESSRSIEHRVFSEVTAALLAAEEADVIFSDRIKAAHRNRELWQTLAFDLADSGNALPDKLRAQLLSIAIWVSRETDQVIKENGPLEHLIEVNRSIMSGLINAVGHEAV